MTAGFLHACAKRVERTRKLCAGFGPDLPPGLLGRTADVVFQALEAASRTTESVPDIVLVLARPDLFYSPEEVERLLRAWVADAVPAELVPPPALDLFVEALLAQLLVERSSLGEPGAQRARIALGDVPDAGGLPGGTAPMAPSPGDTPVAGEVPGGTAAVAPSPDAPPARPAGDAPGDAPDGRRIGGRQRSGHDRPGRNNRVTR
ncbi:hypothetical protein [Actinomadura sp. DC4]|uniref:hypothetical protein n=1 Tax=Actinomadura sp. DC4 TaxID=3055069 RepID=UPI0025B131B2|nr:hypothetical protein [Actinomadura sp. DC4]MDN3359100.1 hypothetical protein [Actinomadura sp. DC4]